MYFTANQVAGASNTVNLTSLTVFQNTAKTAGGGLYLALNQLAGAAIIANVDNNIFDDNYLTAGGVNQPPDVTLANVGGATWKETFNLVRALNNVLFNPNNGDILDDTTGLATTPRHK